MFVLVATWRSKSVGTFTWRVILIVILLLFKIYFGYVGLTIAWGIILALNLICLVGSIIEAKNANQPEPCDDLRCPYCGSETKTLDGTCAKCGGELSAR